MFRYVLEHPAPLCRINFNMLFCDGSHETNPQSTIFRQSICIHGDYVKPLLTQNLQYSKLFAKMSSCTFQHDSLPPFPNRQNFEMSCDLIIICSQGVPVCFTVYQSVPLFPRVCLSNDRGFPAMSQGVPECSRVQFR